MNFRLSQGAKHPVREDIATVTAELRLVAVLLIAIEAVVQVDSVIVKYEIW